MGSHGVDGIANTAKSGGAGWGQYSVCAEKQACFHIFTFILQPPVCTDSPRGPFCGKYFVFVPWQISHPEQIAHPVEMMALRYLEHGQDSKYGLLEGDPTNTFRTVGYATQIHHGSKIERVQDRFEQK